MNAKQDHLYRPHGANADEWRLFLSCHVDSRATSVDGLSFAAVQIAEAIEAERARCVAIVKRWFGGDDICDRGYECVQEILREI